MDARLAEIYEQILPVMAANHIEDTVPNRIAFLTGLQDAWKEDDNTSFEKSLYMLALSTEIDHLKLKNIFN